MTEQLEIRIPFEELVSVSFQCTKCHGEMTLDLRNKQHRGIAVKQEGARLFCVLCGAQFDGYLHDAFSGLFNWYDAAKKSGHKIFFRVNRESENGNVEEKTE